VSKLVSNNIKTAVMYLYDQGRTCRYLSIKFDVSLNTIYRWVRDRDKIYEQNAKDLEHMLYGYLVVNSIDWYGEG
jgi:transposase